MGIAMIERKGTKLRLIGKVHPTDEQTFSAIVRAKEPVTAVELKDRLEVNLNAVNERLNKLVSLGLVRREKGTSAAGREQFQYCVTA
jgi:predicted transcriptional regulator